MPYHPRGKKNKKQPIIFNPKQPPLKADQVIGEGVEIYVTTRTYVYMVRAYEFLPIAGSLGKGEMKLDPEFQRLMEAFHHFLAGGELADKLVKKEGLSPYVDELNLRLKEAVEETNLVNKKYGFYKAN